MRTSIVVWSTLSGTILGLFADAALVGAVVLVSAVIPTSVLARLQSRWIGVIAVIVFAAVPVVLSVLGYLEGELKTV